ncbi:7132_t:CDS:10 [Entrophospora sp. SA101]|nr:7132_t:CDS:10 [Entrophospora sp. SA101]
MLSCHHAKSKKKEVRRRKKAVKALQNHVTAQRMISILKAMPEPDSPLVTSIGVEIDKNDSIKNLSGSDTTSSATIPLSKDTVYVKNKENDEKELMSGRTITKTSSIKDGSKIVVSSSTSTTDVTITTTIKANSLKTNSTNKDKIIKPSLNTISCYVYWWGYEVYVPQKCMGRLDQAQNVSNSFLGLLHIVVGNSSPISPYFGLISAWVGLQFTLIKSQNVGNGVVLAATWVLPIALMPRPCYIAKRFEKMDLDDEPVEFKINHQYAKKYEIRKRGEELSKLKEKYDRSDLNSEDVAVSDSTSEEEDEYGELITPEVDAQILAATWVLPIALMPRPCYIAKRFEKMDLDDEPVEFKINHQYAKKYEIRKRGEELSKLKEKYDRSDLNSEDVAVSDSTSEEEDEYGELITPEVDAQIMKTITAIRSKDPKVYNSQANFFADEEIEKARKQWQEKQKKKKSGTKPIHLKDYHRQILLKNGGNDDSDSDNDISTKAYNKKLELTPIEEEQKLKEELKAMASTIDNVNENQIKEWQNFKENPNVDNDEAFLTEYILNRGWVDKDLIRIPTYEELVAEHHDSEEDEFDEAVDNFESKYNFRSTKITTYSRNVEGSMRRIDNKRKIQRYDREERKAEEKKKKMEELKRFKNLKKKEIHEKLQKIKEITGNENVGFDEVDLEEDFNPEKYDDKMQKIFDEEFYNKQASDDEYLDEYYQLNYEDIIDDTPVRFKYNKVKSTSFGLTPTEILLADEKDLNEFVSLKKYAPYRPDNVVEKDLKKYSKKKRLREFRKKIEKK